VLSSLEILQRAARGVNWACDLVDPDDLTRGRADAPMRFEVEVQLNGARFEYALVFELPPGFRCLRVAEERLTHNGQAVFQRESAKVSLMAESGKPTATFGFDWHYVALPIIQRSSESDPVVVFREWLASMVLIAPIPQLMTGESSGDTLFPDRDCSNIGAWFAGLMAHSPAAYGRMDALLKTVMPDLKDVRNPAIGKRARSISVQFERDQETFSLEFDRLSQGEKCFFAGSLLLAANESYGPLFCFWDEPDNYLSLPEVGHFVAELRKSMRRGGQLLVTSHNPEAIRRFSDENTLLLSRKSWFEPTQVRLVEGLDTHDDVVDALIRDDLEP